MQTLDFWSLPDAQVAQTLRQTYLRLAQQRPDLYDRIYRLDQHTWRGILEGNQALPAVLAEGLEYGQASPDHLLADPPGTAAAIWRGARRAR